MPNGKIVDKLKNVSTQKEKGSLKGLKIKKVLPLGKFTKYA